MTGPQPPVISLDLASVFPLLPLSDHVHGRAGATRIEPNDGAGRDRVVRPDKKGSPGTVAVLDDGDAAISDI